MSEGDADVSYRARTRAGKAGPRRRKRGALIRRKKFPALILAKTESRCRSRARTTRLARGHHRPAYFNDAQRNATKRAGELAGFTVERIVNEPTAAALAYGLDKLEEPREDRGLRSGRRHLRHLDSRIERRRLRSSRDERQYAPRRRRYRSTRIDSERFLPPQDFRLDETAEHVARLREAADRREASAFRPRTKCDIDLPFLDGAESFLCDLTRARVGKAQRAPIVERTRAHCLRALADAKLTPRDLDEVILVGGDDAHAAGAEDRRARFSGASRTPSQNPDEAVAIGATIQAGILSGAVRDVVLLDVTPLSLGIETFGGLMNVIIPRNSTIPIKAGEMFTTAVNQPAVDVDQGAARRARNGAGQLAAWANSRFEFEPAPKGVARVGVQFEIDANGILHVLARDTKTGAEKIVEINSAVDVSDEAVEAMIADSLDHAFDDMSERVWTEAKLKAEEMLRAVSAAFAQLGDAIEPAEKEKIETGGSSVREAATQRSKTSGCDSALDKAPGLAALCRESDRAASDSRNASERG